MPSSAGKKKRLLLYRDCPPVSYDRADRLVPGGQFVLDAAATPQIHTLSLHDALPISPPRPRASPSRSDPQSAARTSGAIRRHLNRAPTFFLRLLRTLRSIPLLHRWAVGAPPAHLCTTFVREEAHHVAREYPPPAENQRAAPSNVQHYRRRPLPVRATRAPPVPR